MLSLILIAGILVYALWHNEISTVASIKMLAKANEENKSGPVYIMDVSEDYYFDEFIAWGGVSNDGESDKNTITVWSALYNLTDKTVTWVSNEEFGNEKAVFTFDFSYLD